MGKKILLADDSITIQKVIELTFSDEDFEVVTVGNGRLALEKLDEVRPDVVLCDIIMPEKDGYEVCDHIKKHPSLSHVPVLLLTGAFEPFDQERAARVGCDGYLAKPFEPQTLIAKVKDLLNQTASRPRVASAPAPTAEFAPPAVKAPPAAAPAAFVPPAEPLFEPITEPEPVYDAVEPGPVDEPAAPAGTYSRPLELTPEPGTPPPPYAEATEPGAVEDLLDGEPVEASPEEFMPLMAEETESLQPPVPEAEPAPPAGGFEGARTVIFQADETPPWSSPTVEVPLEDRAQASAAASAASESGGRPVFAEAPPPASGFGEPGPGGAEEPVFEPDFGEPVEPASDAPVEAPPAPAVVASPPLEPPAESSAEPTPEPAYASFADLRPEEPATPVGPSSQAAEVSVPVEQVAQIAQRVVAQISEKVVREVAWEVVPDLAEALIKKEIERLRAELDKV